MFLKPLIDNFKQNTYLGYLALARFVMGYHFLENGISDHTPRYLSGAVMINDLNRGGPADPFQWHAALMQAFIVPHANFMGHLHVYGEMAIGVSLLTGCLVRVSASFAALLNLNILLGIAWAQGAPFALNRVYVAVELAFVFASAGRALGLDAFLHKRFPRSIFF